MSGRGGYGDMIEGELQLDYILKLLKAYIELVVVFL